MANECALISAGLNINCDNPVQPGTEEDLILFNWEEFKDAVLTRNVTDTQIIEDISLPSGVVGYRFKGQNNSLLPKHNLVKGSFIDFYNHEIAYKLFDLGPDVKKIVENKARGRFVAIIQNKYKRANGNSAYEIYGLDAGLIVDSVERDPGSTDTQGLYSIVLKSHEAALEPHLPASLFIADYVTTKDLVESLI